GPSREHLDRHEQLVRHLPGGRAAGHEAARIGPRAACGGGGADRGGTREAARADLPDMTRIETVTEADLPELLPLMRGYCDLYVVAEGRGSGAAEALIGACVERCRERGAVRLEWQTALDNHRARAVYERVGGKRERWLSYSLDA